MEVDSCRSTYVSMIVAARVVVVTDYQSKIAKLTTVATEIIDTSYYYNTIT